MVIRLDDFKDMCISDCDALGVDEMESLQYQLKQRKDELDSLSAKWHGVMARRYENEAHRAIKAKGSDFGTASYTPNNVHEVAVTIPKRVEWDQELLKNAIKELESSGEDIHEYVVFETIISENKYKSWPKKIQKIFDPARMTKPGKTVFKIKRKDDE